MSNESVRSEFLTGGSSPSSSSSHEVVFNYEVESDGSCQDVTFNKNITESEDSSPHPSQETEDDETESDEAWLVAVKAKIQELYPSAVVQKVLTANDFQELGLPSATALAQIMYPRNAGSLARFILQLKIGDFIRHILVKEISNIKYGENEIMVGRAIQLLELAYFIPAIGGIKAQSSSSAEHESYFVLVPWKNGSSIHTLVREKKKAFTLVEVLRAIGKLLADLDKANSKAEFIHRDCNENQVLVVTAPSLTLYLIDFGHATVDFPAEGITVPGRQSSRTYIYDLEILFKALNTVVIALTLKLDSDAAILAQWKTYVRSYKAYNTVGLPIICGWIQNL